MIKNIVKNVDSMNVNYISESDLTKLNEKTNLKNLNEFIEENDTDSSSLEKKLHQTYKDNDYNSLNNNQIKTIDQINDVIKKTKEFIELNDIEGITYNMEILNKIINQAQLSVKKTLRKTNTNYQYNYLFFRNLPLLKSNKNLMLRNLVGKNIYLKNARFNNDRRFNYFMKLLLSRPNILQQEISETKPNMINHNNNKKSIKIFSQIIDHNLQDLENSLSSYLIENNLKFNNTKIQEEFEELNNTLLALCGISSNSYVLLNYYTKFKAESVKSKHVNGDEKAILAEKLFDNNKLQYKIDLNTFDQIILHGIRSKNSTCKNKFY
jgi:hypothetical protein